MEEIEIDAQDQTRQFANRRPDLETIVHSEDHRIKGTWKNDSMCTFGNGKVRYSDAKKIHCQCG